MNKNKYIPKNPPAVVGGVTTAVPVLTRPVSMLSPLPRPLPISLQRALTLPITGPLILTLPRPLPVFALAGSLPVLATTRRRRRASTLAAEK